MAKMFILKGDICRAGNVEVPSDEMTVREVIDKLGGGMKDGKAVKAVQIGGPSGGLLTGERLDLPLNFKTLATYGIRRGNGTITVLSEDRCIVDAVYRVAESTQDEFCGRCVPCREGNKRISEMMEMLYHYKLSRDNFNVLQDMGEMVAVTSLCALGKGSYNTLRTAVAAFGDEFEAHLSGHCKLCEKEKREEINVCGVSLERKNLVIDPDKCRGCGRCARNCHTEAISGEIKSPFSIDVNKCVKCYTCMENCSFGAIEEVEVNG